MLWMLWDVVSAYDFSVDFTDDGKLKESIAYTVVHLTIVRQHSSCKDRTTNRKFLKYIN